MAEPNVYDKGKIKGPMEALRMPNLHLTKEQIQALTTFLLGSQQLFLPESYQYVPGDARRDIQEGWWVVKKYNCMGCHQFIPGQRTVMMGLQRNIRMRRSNCRRSCSPKGARVDPEWLRKFLTNPALSESDTNRNGVRPYMHPHADVLLLGQ